MDKLFEIFEKHQYYNIQDLVRLTNQPIVSFLCFYINKVLKSFKLPVSVGLLFSFLADQPLTLTSPGHWATFGNYHSGLPEETHLFLCAANILCPGISNLHRHTNSDLGHLETQRFIS